jgi:hypothetical protein
VQRALYLDLRKSVELSEDTGWVADTPQIQENAEHILRSTCQVDAAQRDGLDAWLSGQIMLAGGPAEQLYREHEHDLTAAEDSLTLERTRAQLRYGSTHAKDDCPFWLEPDPKFAGVQGDADRFVVLAETIGYGSLVLQSGDAGFGGGGGGRLLFGHGIGSRFTLAVGAELGGLGTFAENDDGSRNLDTTFLAGVPVLLRFLQFSRVIDLEVAAITRPDSHEELFPPGLRVSLSGGFATMRASAFLPYALLVLGYQYHPPDHGEAAEHSGLIGTRVGIDWDP